MRSATRPRPLNVHETPALLHPKPARSAPTPGPLKEHLPLKTHLHPLTTGAALGPVPKSPVAPFLTESRKAPSGSITTKNSCSAHHQLFHELIPQTRLPLSLLAMCAPKTQSSFVLKTAFWLEVELRSSRG